MTTNILEQELALDELRSLYEMVKALHSADGGESIVSAFLERLSDVVPFETCAVMLTDSYPGKFEITHAAGQHAASLVGRKVTSGEGISGWVLANRHPFSNTDPMLDLPLALLEKFNNYRTLAVFPIIKENDLFGAVALYSSSLSKYDATHQRMISEASNLLALALSSVLQAEPVEGVQQKTSNFAGSRVSQLLNNSSTFPIYKQAAEHSH